MKHIPIAMIILGLMLLAPRRIAARPGDAQPSAWELRWRSNSTNDCQASPACVALGIPVRGALGVCGRGGLGAPLRIAPGVPARGAPLPVGGIPFLDGPPGDGTDIRLVYPES